MPELPEVETVKTDLTNKIPHLSVVRVEIYDQRIIQNLANKSFQANITGKTFSRVQRRGKALILHFKENGYLVVQLKMTGQLIYSQHFKQEENPKDTKAVFKLSNGHFLIYNDQRTFGWLIYTDDLSKISFLGKIGPEPLGKLFNGRWLKENLRKRKAPIKNLLMNQDFLAGIGNIYASEILFKARIHPQRPAGQLSGHEIEGLYKATQSILKEAIKHRGCSMRNYRDAQGRKGNFINRIKVYARDAQGCYNCRQPIVRIVQAGRSTYFCQRCQS